VHDGLLKQPSISGITAAGEDILKVGSSITAIFLSRHQIKRARSARVSFAREPFVAAPLSVLPFITARTGFNSEFSLTYKKACAGRIWMIYISVETAKELNFMPNQEINSFVEIVV
jgi:hypothetical protein